MMTRTRPFWAIRFYTYIDGGAGNDTIIGSDANEEIVGGAGDDDLQGGAGDDVLTDSQGTNTLSGGSGDDIINLTGTSNPQGTIDGGEGIDTLRSCKRYQLLEYIGVER